MSSVHKSDAVDARILKAMAQGHETFSAVTLHVSNQRNGAGDTLRPDFPRKVHTLLEQMEAQDLAEINRRQQVAADLRAYLQGIEGGSKSGKSLECIMSFFAKHLKIYADTPEQMFNIEFLKQPYSRTNS